MSTSVRFENVHEFEIAEAHCAGVKNGRYGDYSVPIVFDKECPEFGRIRALAQSNNCVLKMLGDDENMHYFNCDQLTPKQIADLLGKDNMKVHLKFKCTGTYQRKDGTQALRLSVTKLAKVRVAEKFLRPAPED